MPQMPTTTALEVRRCCLLPGLIGASVSRRSRRDQCCQRSGVPRTRPFYICIVGWHPRLLYVGPSDVFICRCPPCKCFFRTATGESTGAAAWNSTTDTVEASGGHTCDHFRWSQRCFGSTNTASRRSSSSWYHFWLGPMSHLQCRTGDLLGCERWGVLRTFLQQCRSRRPLTWLRCLGPVACSVGSNI